jgi:hypothetical protein
MKASQRIDGFLLEFSRENSGMRLAKVRDAKLFVRLGLSAAPALERRPIWQTGMKIKN